MTIIAAITRCCLFGTAEMGAAASVKDGETMAGMQLKLSAGRPLL